MTLLALGSTEGRLAVMTFAAELVLIEGVHLHSGTAFLIFEDRRMAAAAIEHCGMHLVAKYCGRHIAGRVTEVFFQARHVMALGAFLCGECNSAVMTSAAGAAFIHLVHHDVRSALFHLEELWVALAAAVFSCMVLVGERHRQS